MGIDPEYLVAAYEDPMAYLMKERQLPINVDPKNNKQDQPEERERLRRVFEQGLERTYRIRFAGAERNGGKSGPEWQTSLWMLRAQHLFLMPGDSPIGWKLRCRACRWEPVSLRQQLWELDPPMATTDSLPIPARDYERMAYRRQQSLEVREVPRGAGFSAGAVVRTALAVEPRNGQLCVFLPPVTSADDYVELVAAVEDTATTLKMPVAIEGYLPPFDSRLRQIKVTPDPGVIEVNIHPSSNWAQLVENTVTLYEEARQCRLGTEKFMLDGRHTGTGGGNHVVLGGITPSDSPFLRRPDLLKSMVGYWLNHPSLSYLFSGLFIGPTSQ